MYSSSCGSGQESGSNSGSGIGRRASRKPVNTKISCVIPSHNSTIMCYGQTAAGKTFTMTGSTSNYKYRGLIPRAISNIFSEVGGRFDTQITVRVSFIEIYNELLFDMLSGVPPHEQSGSAISV